MGCQVKKNEREKKFRTEIVGGKKKKGRGADTRERGRDSKRQKER